MIELVYCLFCRLYQTLELYRVWKMKLIRIATKETDVLECGVVTGAGKITRTREWKIENREIGCEVEQRRMSRPRLWQEGTVFVLHLTHWPSDAAKLTDYRAMAVGRGGEGGINGASREEKTGRLTEWGKREWGITALWMAGARYNPSELTGTVQYMYVHVCAVASLWVWWTN